MTSEELHRAALPELLHTFAQADALHLDTTPIENAIRNRVIMDAMATTAHTSKKDSLGVVRFIMDEAFPLEEDTAYVVVIDEGLERFKKGDLT